MTDRRREVVLILVLLAGAALLWLWAIPTTTRAFTMRDPGDISPRLIPQLATLLIAGAAALRLVRLGLAEIAERRTGETTDVSLPLEGVDRRSVVVVLVVAVYAFLAVGLLGFYLASLLLVAGLLGFLGERRVLVLALFPVLMVGSVWVLFERVFSIPLPRGVVGRALLSMLAG